MIFTKTPFYRKHKHPIDGGYTCKDGRRALGENKTWIGFVSMVLFCTAFQILLGILCNSFGWNDYNQLYDKFDNTIWYNALFGFIVGLVYMVSELPNSFIKRRLNIDAGKTKKGFVGSIFFVVDQIDSLVGVMFVLYLFSGFSIGRYFGYVGLGALTHIVVNLVLYFSRVRKNV